jgi:hypothetical protein
MAVFHSGTSDRGTTSSIFAQETLRRLLPMSKRKRNAQARTSILIALTMSIVAFAPIISFAPASAQLFPTRNPSNNVSRRGRVVIPEGTQIPVRYEKAEKILVTKDETAPLTLQVAANIRNRAGVILIPAGSEIIGELRPRKGGSQFVAEKIVIDREGERTIERSLDATSDVVTRTEVVEKGASAGDILEGAAIGGAAATVLSEILGDIDIEEVLGGAGLGALAGWILGSGKAELISIDPNSDLTLTLNSDLVLRR